MTKEKIVDYISGKEVEAKPEEIEAVQPFLKSLVEDYGYSKESIMAHPQFKVKQRPSGGKEYPVDIAVFKSDKKDEDDVYIVVECKKKTRKDGRSQLEDYLRFCRAKLGVWYNGNERLFLRKIEKDGEIIFEEIPNIPNNGQRIEDIGKFKRTDLKPTHNLKSVFNTIRNYLAGNATGYTEDTQLAQFLIDIVFCKIFDERFTPPPDVLRFRAGINEDPDSVKERILSIFADVKKKYKEVILASEEILLDSKCIAYVVGELQNYSLTDSERDVVADAFETFIGRTLKGDKGQFFTPRNIIRMIVNIIDPNDDDVIIDPCCGSGGFLIETLKHVWNKIDKDRRSLGWSDAAINEDKQKFAMTKIMGIEKDMFLTKTTKAYMAILGDGKGNIFCEDSLENPKQWSENARINVKSEQFSCLMTNPPFGKKITVEGENKLKQYRFGYKYNKKLEKTNILKKKETPQILFIERDLQLLRTGGKMAIVLPETYLHAPSVRYIINEISKSNNIFAVVDLPHNTFRPYCNAKCIVLFVQKGVKQQKEITMAVMKQMGHNHQGRPIYRWDDETKKYTDEIWDDSTIVVKEFKNPKSSENKLVFNVNADEIKNCMYVPRYYWTKCIEGIKDEAEKSNCKLIPFGQLIDEGVVVYEKGHGSPPSEYKGTGDVFYVRAGDIMDWDIYKNPTSSIPLEVYQDMTKGKVVLESLDILFVKEGSYRVGDVALLSQDDTGVMLNHHTLVFKIAKQDNEYGIDAYYLLFLLSHSIVKKQHYNKIMIDTTLPNIGDRWKELLLPISNDEKVRKEISEKLRKTFTKKWNIQMEFKKIKEEYSGCSNDEFIEYVEVSKNDNGTD